MSRLPTSAAVGATSCKKANTASPISQPWPPRSLAPKLRSRPMFKVGDMVKPKPGWDKNISMAGGMQYALPAGRVTDARPWGRGQVIKVGDSRYHEAGCFEPDDSMRP